MYKNPSDLREESLSWASNLEESPFQRMYLKYYQYGCFLCWGEVNCGKPKNERDEEQVI